jgi:hypothetical protein
MSDASVFHAYIVGGKREDARVHVEELLGRLAVERTANADCLITEHVTFSIDDARALRLWQGLTSMHGGKKVRVVYADFINREAEHTLLKTLEEPVPDTHIIFAVPNPDVLLPTLLSRVRVVMPARNRDVFSGVDGDTKSDARKFLALSRAGRLAHVATLVEKGDDEDAAAEVRERALTLMNDLERALAETPEKNRESLALILKLKRYLYTPGGSARIILETLAITC